MKFVTKLDLDMLRLVPLPAEKIRVCDVLPTVPVEEGDEVAAQEAEFDLLFPPDPKEV